MANAYRGAEEQVKLAYGAVKTEIMAQTVKNGTYDATTSANTLSLANKVKSDLKDTSKWNVDGSTPGQIKITYTDSKIDKDSIEKGTPSEEGRVVSVITLKKQDATVAFDAWVYNHTDQTVTKGDLVLKIGDNVNTASYTVDGKTFDGKWRVLGEEDGQLMLVSTNYVDFTGSVDSEGTPLIKLQGSNGIENEVARLNTLSAKFADGTKTEKGRSITVEDINKITGYDPEESRLNPNDLTQKGPCKKSSINQYGNNVTYTLKDDTYVWYKGDQAVTTETKSTYKKFWLPGTNSNITSPYTVKSTYYSYYPKTLGAFPGSDVASGQTMEGISTSSGAYDMLFKPQSNIPYWLASPCVYAFAGNVNWILFFVPSGMVTGSYLWNSSSGSGRNRSGVRPAVSLKSNILPTFVSTDSSSGISTYQI